MNWKTLLKRQTNLLQFADQANMNTAVPKIKSFLESQKGRSQIRTGQGMQDSSEYFLGELSKVNSPEEFEQFKQLYKKNTNMDIMQQI